MILYNSAGIKCMKLDLYLESIGMIPCLDSVPVNDLRLYIP